MPYRSFRDAEGREWEAWDVVPQLGERRVAERRGAAPEAQPAFDRRRGLERRLIGTRRDPGLAQGWLCFETRSGKRRLWPIPTDWPRCDESRLVEYFLAARPVRRPSGRPQPGARRPGSRPD